jgi:transcriptional antiterminator RfaH
MAAARLSQGIALAHAVRRIRNTPGNNMLRWVAISTKSHQEKYAASCIEQLNIETFLPRIEEKPSRCGAKCSIVPMFPGYLFARIDPLTHYRAVKYAKGVRRIVEFGSSPAFVDDQLIESIRSNLDEGVLRLRSVPLQPGEVVRIIRGPLQGIEAVFQGHLSGTQRVVLLLKAITYQSRLVIPQEMVGNQ